MINSGIERAGIRIVNWQKMSEICMQNVFYDTCKRGYGHAVKVKAYDCIINAYALS
jgi:hypothetical protein